MSNSCQNLAPKFVKRLIDVARGTKRENSNRDIMKSESF